MGVPSGRPIATAMAEVARALQAEETTQQTLQKMVNMAVTTITGCDHAAVSIIGKDRIHTPATSDDVPVQVDRIQYETNQGPCLSAIRDGDMYVTGDLRKDERWPAFAARVTETTGVRSMLSFRLYVEDENLGGINFYSRRADAFDEDSIAVGRLFAAHAAIALSATADHDRSEQRAEHFQRQARIAIHLQRSMLPGLPDLRPLSACARYVPATESAEIGGDWYDGQVLASGDVLLVVGDVTGHDLDAATAMTQVRTTLRALAVNYDAAPGELLTRLDQTLDRLGEYHLGTCVLARITRRDGDWYARLATAGHPSPLLIAPEGARYVDLPPQLLLGVEVPTDRQTVDVRLGPGTTLLLYTDGLVERRDRQLPDGLIALRETAARLHASDVDTLCDTLLRELAPHPSDDVCVLAVRTPSGDSRQT